MQPSSRRVLSISNAVFRRAKEIYAYSRGSGSPAGPPGSVGSSHLPLNRADAKKQHTLIPDKNMTKVKILNQDELLIAEDVLLKHQPKSLKVCGFLHAINRNKPTTLKVFADSWPDFKVMVCLTDPNVTYFSMDEQVLKRMLTEENVIDWSSDFMMAGFDFSHAPLLEEVSSMNMVNSKVFIIAHLMYLPNCSPLLTSAADSELESRISTLNHSHVDLVNETWKFGGDKKKYNYIKNLISNFPTCCITDEQSRPVSWILLYDYCAMGILYTLPEHRGKGYAKVLARTMAKSLRAQGYPVYCFIEEENVVSYRIFKNLGFTEDPSYRAACAEFNV